MFGANPDPNDALPSQTEHLTGVLTGPRNDALWGRDHADFDFYDAKGAVEHVLETLGINAKFLSLEDSTYAQGMAAEVVTDDRKGTSLGTIGVVSPSVWEQFDAESRGAVMFELDMETLREVVGDKSRANNYNPYPRFPRFTRDLALVADAGVNVGDALRICEQNRLVKSASVFDVYEGTGVEKGKKSIGIRVLYQSDSRTLTSEQVSRSRGSNLK